MAHLSPALEDERWSGTRGALVELHDHAVDDGFRRDCAVALRGTDLGVPQDDQPSRLADVGGYRPGVGTHIHTGPTRPKNRTKQESVAGQDGESTRRKSCTTYRSRAVVVGRSIADGGVL